MPNDASAGRPGWFALKGRAFDALRRASNALFGAELTHRSALARRLHDAAFGLIRALSPAHRRQRRFQRDNPEAPWLVPAAIPAIERLLQPHFAAFEWGSGNSTLWLARRVGRLTSIEGRRDWWETVRARLAAAEADLRLVEVPTEAGVPDEVIRRYAGAIDEFPDRSLDLVLVDGHFRLECLQAALPKVRPGGYLVVDNADVPILAPVLARLRPGLLGAWNNGIWETRVYRAPEAGFSAP